MHPKVKEAEMRYAKAVCLFVFLVLGFCGWYENHVPSPVIADAPQVNVAQGQP